jgi:hypothetical protein
MAIRITRNEEGNCITFVGSSNPAYWNACLSAQLNENDANRVDIINDIRTANEDAIQYEFYAVRYQDFADRDNNEFTSAQEMVDYVNANANVIGLSTDVGKDLTGISIDFRHDATSTSIIMDNGFAFGVNTIKAVGDVDGTIHIHAIGTGTPDNGDSHTRKHFEKLDHTNVSINGTAVPGGLQDVVNALNEYFTVGAFEAVVISDPYSTMIADVEGVDAGYTLEGTTAVDPVGNDVFGNTTAGNLAGLKSTATIDQAGEYYTFDIRGEGQIGFGLVHTQESYDDGHYTGNASYANPATFAVGNSAHYGYQFSHWFHPTPNGSWTNYGANTSYSMRPGWSNWDQKQDWLDGNPVKVRCGIDTNGYISIESLQDDGSWVVHARSGYPVPEGSEYHLGIKASGSAPRVYSAPKVHLLEEEAPTMYFRYIESPDGVYQYPLFSSAEEADYYDKTTQGSETGSSHVHVFPDDPTYTQWYMPDHNATMDGTEAPTGQAFDGNAINYTEITSLTNADLVPAAFTDTTITVDELSAVNYQLAPVDAGYTTTIGGIPTWSLVDGTTLQGTAPEVTGNYVDNPSDTATVTVYRTNTYGSSQGTLTINITNLTAPATAISGFNHHSGSDPLADSDTMDDGSAIHMNNTIADGERFVIDGAYVETNILPALQGPGDKYYIGLAVTGHDFATVDDADFDAAIMWEYESATSHTFKFLRDGSVYNNIVVSSATQSVYDFAIEIDGTSAWLIACNTNSINTQPSPSEGGTFTNTYEATNLDEAAPHKIHMAVVGSPADFSTTDLATISTPAPAVTNLTSWTKALDFSGSSEFAVQVNGAIGVAPIRMGSLAVTTSAPGTAGNTSSDTNARPWATAIVFKSDGNSSNQHIWNQGEGASTGDDNIYVRQDASGNMYFGWGRSGALNECRIGDGFNTPTQQWFGLYVAHNGTRLSGANATAANLADAFDIRFMRRDENNNNVWEILTGGYADGVGNRSTTNNWNAGTTGGRMDRSVEGYFSIGGRRNNRNFHGKVASMVVTTLRTGVAMPADAEIEMMITDPKQWEDDYRVGQLVRWAYSTSITTYNPSNYTYGYGPVQIWLMGDGGSDSYANGIRNEVHPSDQNNTKLNLNSMVSNDIQNVTIPGLS